MLTNLHVFTSALKLTMVSRTPGARGVYVMFRFCLAASLWMPTLLAQLDTSLGSYSWISNVGGLAFATLLVLKTIPEERKEFTDALRDMAAANRQQARAITLLRVHLAAKFGDPGAVTPSAARRDMFAASTRVTSSTDRVAKAAQQAQFKNLGHAAAYTRNTARWSIKRSDTPAAVGDPVHSKTGRAKDGRALRGG